MRETEFAEVNQNLEKPVIIIKNLQKILFTWRVFVCYTTEVASHAHLLCMQKYTRSEIPADGALRCEAGSPGKRTGRKKLTKKENKHERYFNETAFRSRRTFRTSDKKMEP